MTPKVPTVDDLRVKLCYICREEERYDDENNDDPPRAWTHPCKCTLIAHEQCLLKWIQTSQGSSSRAANALKCPQCGATYELESNYPMLLKFLATGNKALQRLGRLFTLFGVATFVGVVGSGIYIILTGYGAWALKKFIGKEMFDLLLTDDPTNWSWAAYFNLPLLPISLIVSRMQTGSTIPAIIPILLVWPPSPPVGLRQQLLKEYWTDPTNARRLALTALPPTRSWPPSPFAFGLFFVPLARSVYRMLYARLAFWVLGAKAASLLPAVRVAGENRLVVRRNGQERREEPPGQHENVVVDVGGGDGDGNQGARREVNEEAAEQPQPQQQQQQGEQREQGEQGHQVIWQWNAFGPLVLRIRANMREVMPRDQQHQQGEANPNPNPNANGQAHPILNPILNPQAAAAVEAAEQQIEVNTTSLGRQIGGALLIPAISSWMGSLLFRLARHSQMLRRFLGIKASAAAAAGGIIGSSGWNWWWRKGVAGALGSIGGGTTADDGSMMGGVPGGLLLLPPPPLGPWSYGSWNGLSTWEQIKLVVKLTLNATWGGSRTWAGSDPVWWRNSIGLGLFVVAKDCLQLLHLWLTKRELETRRVKNRDFSGVDVNELDLVPSWAGR